MPIKFKQALSFANYYNPDRIHFGALRVVNDDIIDGGQGFGKHPHDNMEIVSIPLAGALEHQDSMGNTGIIRAGEIQVMSAGTGIYHSEFNANKEIPVSLFQIWILPNIKGVEPRYAQKTFDFASQKNNLVEVISPSQDDDSLWLHQDAWLNIGYFDLGKKAEYQLKNKNNAVFVMTIEGHFSVSGIDLNRRDAVGIYDVDKIEIESMSDDAHILFIEVPLSI